MRVLLRIEGFFKWDRVKNVDLRGRLKQEGVLDMVKKRWQQRVVEMSINRVTKMIYDVSSGVKHFTVDCNGRTFQA